MSEVICTQTSSESLGWWTNRDGELRVTVVPDIRSRRARRDDTEDGCMPNRPGRGYLRCVANERRASEDWLPVAPPEGWVEAPANGWGVVVA